MGIGRKRHPHGARPCAAERSEAPGPGKATFVDGLGTDDALAAIERIEASLTASFPQAKRIYIEPMNLTGVERQREAAERLPEEQATSAPPVGTPPKTQERRDPPSSRASRPYFLCLPASDACHPQAPVHGTAGLPAPIAWPPRQTRRAFR